MRNYLLDRCGIAARSTLALEYGRAGRTELLQQMNVAFAIVASFISITRRSKDIAIAVIASFMLPIVAVIEAIVVAVTMVSSMSCANVIAGAVVIAT